MAGMDWKNGKWEPNWVWVTNEEFVRWVSKKQPEFFPTPTYHIGDIVQIKLPNAPVREAKITDITLIFDHKLERKLSEAEHITYTAYWNGHGRWVKLDNIVA